MTDRLRRAWLALSVALAAHVVDEAATDFLSVYNPLVRTLRERWSWLPMPTFRFDVWLTGLVVAVLTLLAVTPLVSAGSGLARALALPFAVVVGLLNGLGHLAGSLLLGRWLPGATTAPALIVCGAWLVGEAVTRRQSADEPPRGRGVQGRP